MKGGIVSSERTGRRGVGLVAWVTVIAATLAACATTGSLPGVVTIGNIKVFALDPNVLECTVRVGDWIGVEGQNFGTRDAWASGELAVTFAPDPPGVQSTDVQLADLEGPGAPPDAPQYLYVRVPVGAETGTMVIDAGEDGIAQVPVQILATTATDIGPASAAVTMCQQIEPPP